ncbi:hypothetical protein HDU87_008374 [Geranomyces variabilis]|uniref:Aldehyde dehydrogenase domain-containing protein n=1 Tax=Geranomyces variabilis TaxID=109894 RepID=A0AAD5TD93_9FUNG|nr:hypothetical protein HDU87_008374 [Geranomyces variabilis]
MTYSYSPELAPFLRELSQLIDGQKSLPTGKCAEASLDPEGTTRDANTLEPLSPIVATSEADVAKALSAAVTFHRKGEWAKKTLAERQEVFDRLAAELEKRGTLIGEADSIDIGAVGMFRKISETLSPIVFRRSLDKMLKEFPAHREVLNAEGAKIADASWLPRGPAVVICPTNAPVGSSMVQLGYAIQSGCPVIVKPSPWSAHSFNVVIDAICAADVPAGLIQIVQGGAHVGKALVDSPLVKSVCFTGSVAAGLEVAATCSKRLAPYVLELGGANPFIVLRDADVEAAARVLISSLSLVNGQYCCGAGRVLVHADVRAAFLDAFTTQAAAIKLGHSLNEETETGPLCVGLERPLKSRIEEIVKAGATLLESTPQPTGLAGTFMGPTLLLDPPTSLAPEIFGPVATLNTFTTIDQAIDLAQISESRLKGYVFGGKDGAAEIMKGVDCAWWDHNCFQPDRPQARGDGFLGLCGYGELTPPVFMYEKYISLVGES